ncbi:MAG: hypothetical protein IJO05_03510 [Oscillospiraceae bacterium]|nr:hypothetical protein [Oscillospiraceae bacterium]
MRLSEIEEALTLGKCTPELLEQFKAALRRAPKGMRPQHCYTVAAAMPLWQFPMAVELLEYSLELEGTWVDQMRAHNNLADLYERHADYAQAKEHYRLAQDTVPPEQKSAYAHDAASRMLVCQLHLDGFAYSDELRRLYEESLKLDDFSRSFQKCRFYLSLAQILIFLQDDNLSAARAAYELAKSILRPDSEGPLTALLKRKKYIESAGATPEARAFLKRIKKQLP